MYVRKCSVATRLAFVSAFIGLIAPQFSSAQSYPQRPVRFIVPFAPGGGTDVPARLLAPKLTDAMGQQFLVDNRAGANGIVGTDVTAKAVPDGYTVLIVPSGHTINASLYPKLPYDTVKDFASISLIANGAYILVTNSALPVKSVSELIALAKSKPGVMQFGSGGVGNANHLAAELFNLKAGIQLVHVPYKGGGPLMNDLLGGHISMLFATIGTVGAQVHAGKLRALAVTTATRASAFPDIPTMAEAGVPGYEVSGWYALLAPAGTPAPIVNRLSDEMAKIVVAPDVRDKLINQLGLEPVGSKPAVLDAVIRTELKKWEEIIRKLGITAES